MPAASSKSPFHSERPGLQKVRCILAVSSCKGGVGKSTVAVNLAYAIAAEGMRVGLFDADIYGPSLPTMVCPASKELFQADGLILPLESDHVKLMSFGYLPTEEENQAAILRGPIVSNLLNQLLTQTDWGRLDVLVIDYPPGTGDIQLTLSQVAPITAAVIVTTPQKLSFVDVVKGIRMFDKLNVPTIAVVENMSYFVGPDGLPLRVFGEGARRMLEDQYGFRDSFELPIVPEISACGDSGRPYVLTHPESETAEVFQDMARRILPVLDELSTGKRNTPDLLYNVGENMVLRLPDGSEFVFSPVALRMVCRSAHRVDELTGVRRELREHIPEDVYPTRIMPTGNYAVSIEWSDGAPPSLFPWSTLLQHFANDEHRSA